MNDRQPGTVTHKTEETGPNFRRKIKFEKDLIKRGLTRWGQQVKVHLPPNLRT